MFNDLKDLEYYCKIFNTEGANGCSIERIIKDLALQKCTPANCKNCRGNVELEIMLQLHYFK